MYRLMRKALPWAYAAAILLGIVLSLLDLAR
jgi:hypothetical protein